MGHAVCVSNSSTSSGWSRDILGLNSCSLNKISAVLLCLGKDMVHPEYNHDGVPAGQLGKYTFRVQYNGVPVGQLETVRLRPGYYVAASAAEAEDCQKGSWNVLLTTVDADDRVNDDVGAVIDVDNDASETNGDSMETV